MGVVCSHRTGSLFCAALTKLWPGLSDAVGLRLPSTNIGVALLQRCCNNGRSRLFCNHSAQMDTQHVGASGLGAAGLRAYG